MFTFYQDVPLMKILTPNGLKKLRSGKITYCLVNPVLKKFVTWEMRSSETDIFFLEKLVLKNFLPTLQKNTVISWCGNIVERCSFRIVSGESDKTMGKMCLSTKFPHQEIRWNCSIFDSVAKTFSKPVFRKKCQFLMTMSPIFWEQV